MGLIRSAVIFILSAALLIILFFSNTFLIINSSLSYENILENTKNSKLITNNVNLEEIYYKQYDCKLFDCIKQEKSPFVLISQKSKNYFYNNFIFSISLALIIILIIFIFLESRKSIFTLVGITTILSALPFKKIDWAINKITEEEIRSILLVFFSESNFIFNIVIIIGITLLIIGISLEFLGLGLKINTLIDKFRKEKKIKELENKVKKIEKEPEKLTEEKIKTIIKEELNKKEKPIIKNKSKNIGPKTKQKNTPAKKLVNKN